MDSFFSKPIQLINFKLDSNSLTSLIKSNKLNYLMYNHKFKQYKYRYSRVQNVKTHHFKTIKYL